LYERWKDVETEIKRVALLPQEQFSAEIADLHSETLVLVTRLIRESDERFYGALLTEISRRILWKASRWIQGFDDTTTDDLLATIEIEILELILTDKPSRQSDFLEIAFTRVVKCRALDVVRKHRRSVLGHRDPFPVPSLDDDDEEIDPLEGAHDARAGPDRALLDRQDEQQREDWVRIACAAVENPWHLNLAILHYAHGVPIKSDDSNADSLMLRFNATEGQIKYGLKQAMDAMRKALGVKL
jgi:hypothetical protein